MTEDLEFKKGSDYIRFWNKVNKKSTEECWNWLARKDDDGYGRFYLNRRHVFAHRVSFYQKNGIIKRELLMCHTCNNPSCVNPNHLYQGTVKQNTKDSLISGTLYFANAFGEKCPNAKLSNEEVKEIRNLLKTDITQRRIAEVYGVSEATITHIKNGRNWSKI